MAPANRKHIEEKKQGGTHPRNAAETRQRILEAAKNLFSKDVYRNVGTREIAAEAGVNLALISRYFGSKKKLFMEVITSVGSSTDSVETAKNRTLGAVMDFLSEEENPRKKELRLIILSTLDSEVADIVSDFFVRRCRTQAKLIPGNNRETRAILAFSSIVGLALVISPFQRNDNNLLDKDYIENYFKELFEKLYFDKNI